MFREKKALKNTGEFFIIINNNQNTNGVFDVMLYLNIQHLFPDIKRNSVPASTVFHFMRDHITKYMAGYMPASVTKL